MRASPPGSTSASTFRYSPATGPRWYQSPGGLITRRLRRGRRRGAVRAQRSSDRDPDARAVSVRVIAYAWHDHVTSRICLFGEIVFPLFLIGPGSARMTGQLFSVNGGISVA